MTFIYLLSTALPIAYTDGGSDPISTRRLTRRLKQALEEKKESHEKLTNKKKPDVNDLSKYRRITRSKSKEMQAMEESETEEDPTISVRVGFEDLMPLLSQHLPKIVGTLENYQQRSLLEYFSELKLHKEFFYLNNFKNIDQNLHINLILGLYIQLKYAQSLAQGTYKTKISDGKIEDTMRNFIRIFNFSDNHDVKFTNLLQKIYQASNSALESKEVKKSPKFKCLEKILEKEKTSHLPCLIEPLGFAVLTQDLRLLSLINIVCYLKIHSSDKTKINNIKSFIEGFTAPLRISDLKQRIEKYLI